MPLAQPIENFWGHLAQKVYEGDLQTSTEQVLIDRIKLKLQEIDLNFLQLHMKGVSAKLRSIAGGDVFSYKKKKRFLLKDKSFIKKNIIVVCFFIYK